MGNSRSANNLKYNDRRHAQYNVTTELPTIEEMEVTFENLVVSYSIDTMVTVPQKRTHEERERERREG